MTYYSSLPEECPTTINHMKVHLDSAEKSLEEEDYEQVRHDLSIVVLIAEKLGEDNG